jgi:histone acetyltransferase (RNA polymerase elongator complex component)
LRHFNIPVFIPELACPFRCIYCNQYNITGNCKAPDESQVKETIELYLSTLLPGCGRVEVAFFGGSFTGLSMTEQNKYLEVVKPYLEKGLVNGIRISTRPDYISEAILSNLMEKGVVAIELGAQSLDEEVLQIAGRGHGAKVVKESAQMIKSLGFELGLQMMTGLPGDSPGKSIETARAIVALQADTTRIYPTLVIKDTPLAQLFEENKYKPQTFDDAIELCASLFEIFYAANIKVLRVGLHPSESFINGQTLLAGPFHQAFGEHVQTRVWYNRFATTPGFIEGGNLVLSLHPADLNAAIGHKALNKLMFLRYYKSVRFLPDISFKRGHYHVDIY